MTTEWPYRGFGGWTEEPKLFFKRGIEGRIANGWGTKPGDFPFMARMSEKCRFGQRCAICAGSLITDGMRCFYLIFENQVYLRVCYYCCTLLRKRKSLAP